MTHMWRFSFAVLAFLACLAGTARSTPPYIHPEPGATTDQGGQLFNNISWNSTGASSYRVRCLLAGPDSGIAFNEPFFTRGGDNVIYFSKPDFIEWTTTSNTSYDFYYPDAGFPFSFLIHGSLVRYQVNSVPDPLDQYSQRTSVQDNVGPYIRGNTFQCTNVHAGYSGDATGTVEIVDYESGVLRGMVIPFYGGQQGPDLSMSWEGGDLYSFSIPEPGGGWGSIAGEYLTIRVHGYDNAALPHEFDPSWWYNESYQNFLELVEAVGQEMELPFAGESGPEAAARKGGGEGGERSTNFRIQWDRDQNFDPPEGEQDVTAPSTYGSSSVGWLSDGAQYWFRVGHENQFGEYQFGAPVTSVADHWLPGLNNWSAADLTEETPGPWTGSIEVDDIELEYWGGGFSVRGTLQYRIGEAEVQTVNLTVYGDPPGSPAPYYFSIPEPPGGWGVYAGQSIRNMMVKVWDSAAPPDGFGPIIEDNTTYFYPPDELIEAVRPTITLLAPGPGDVLEDEAWIKWNATDDQVPGGADPDGDETEDLLINLSYRDRFTPWSLIDEVENSATQPCSLLWDLSGIPEGMAYFLRAIARDPAGHADTAIVQPFTINVHDPPFITVLAPNGGEVILGEYLIRWTAADPDSNYGELPLTLRIDFSYSPNAGGQWFGISVGSISNDGEELWNINELADGDDYLVKLRVTDPLGLWAEDQSDAPFTIDNNDPPDSVLLISPNGGEMWYGEQTVRWYAHDPDILDSLTIKLNYRRCIPDNPPFWTPLDSTLENTGSYVWDTGLIPAGWYEMQVVAIDRGNLTGIDVSDTCFIINPPDPPTVTVLAPNGGEFWNDTQIILWEADDPDLEYGDTLAALVEVSPDSGANWITLATRLPNSGHLEWNTYQEQFPDGADYLVRVCVTDTFIGTQVCDISDGVFFVLNENDPPAMQLLSPNGGESLRDEILIQWSASDPNSDIGDTVAISLFFSADSGQSWSPPLVESFPNTGSWLWNISSLDDGNTYLVRACATDRQQITVCDESDTTFSIFNNPDNPTVTVISPNGGEHWSGVHEVRWEADDPDLFVGDTLSATVWVDSSLATGFQPLLLADGIPGLPGSFLWDTGAYELPDGDWFRIRVRVTDTDSLSRTDQSDESFLLFNNNDPPTISILSPQTGDIWKGIEAITWEADDPDLQWGDSIAVSLYFRSSTEGDWVPIVLGLADTGVRDWDTESVMDGLEYQIRAVVRDTALAEAEDVSGIFAIENVNEPPAGFFLISPVTGSTVTVFKPLLTWESARDIDAGDRVLYDVWYHLDGEEATSVHAGRDTTLTDQDWTEALQDDSRYTWFVEATDSLGPETTTSLDTWWFVTNIDGNDVPMDFHLLAPSDGALVHPDSVFFAWTPSFDEDVLDTVRYTIHVDTLFSLATATTISVDTLTSWRSQWTFRDNMTHYWRVLARDTNGAEKWSQELWVFTTDRGNDGPATFHLLSPGHQVVLHQAEMDTLQLIWQPAPDPDPLDEVTYCVALFDSIHPADPGWSGGLFELESGNAAALHLGEALTALGDSLADNRIYTWRVTATDSRGAITSSEEKWWFATNDLNEPPLVFDLVSPCHGCTLSTLQPTMCWQPVLDPDPLDRIVYRIEHDVDPLFPTLVIIPDLSQTCWTPDSPFSDRGSVYWRVWAIDRDGLETRCREEWEFIILPQSTIEGLINYPNPFAAGREVTRIQYVLLMDSKVELDVYDLLGNAVWSTSCMEGESGGRRGTNVVEWDGRNQDGEVVGNGGYICLVRVSPLGESTVEKIRKIAVMK